MVVPFLVLNAMVARPVEPVVSLLRPGGHSGLLEYAVLATVLLLLPAGAAIAVRTSERGVIHRWPPLVNAAVAALLVGGFLLITFGLLEDVYRCEVLAIANCD